MTMQIDFCIINVAICFFSLSQLAECGRHAPIYEGDRFMGRIYRSVFTVSSSTSATKELIAVGNGGSKTMCRLTRLVVSADPVSLPAAQMIEMNSRISLAGITALRSVYVAP